MLPIMAVELPDCVFHALNRFGFPLIRYWVFQMVRKTCIKKMDQSDLIEATPTGKLSKLSDVFNAWLILIYAKTLNPSNSIKLQISNCEVFMENIPELGVAIHLIQVGSRVLEI